VSQDVLPDQTAVTNFPGTQPVSGSVSVSNLPGTQPVSAASLPLPSGAAQEHTGAASYHSVRLTDGSAFYAATGGGGSTLATASKGTTAAGSPTSTNVDANTQALDVKVNGTVSVSGTFWQATQPVSGTFWQATQPVSGTVTANQGGTWTVQPGNTANTTAWKVDGSAVTQPVSGTFWQATQPVSGTVTANQGGAPWSDNLTQIGSTAIVTSLAGAAGIGGDTADAAADAGKSVKVGGKVTLNSAALPTALTANQRGPLMIDEYGRPRVVVNRPKVLGGYKFESGRLAVLAAAHASTAGFWWLINPVGSTVLVVIKKMLVTAVPVAVTAFASSPRITLERVTFTGTATGAQITAAKRDSTDATATATIRTASTGLTLTAGAAFADFTVPAVLTAVGVAVPYDQPLYDDTDEDDYTVLRAGEGVVLRQADAGTTSDTRIVMAYGSWEEH